VLKTLEDIQSAFNKAYSDGKKVSLVDLIVLAGCASVEQVVINTGYAVTVPFTPGRMDASQEQTDVKSFAVLEPSADGFRNYQKARYAVSAEEMLVDKAQLLTLTAPDDDSSRWWYAHLEYQLRKVSARRIHKASRGTH
jgi:catalase-peroxidase